MVHNTFIVKETNQHNLGFVAQAHVLFGSGEEGEIHDDDCCLLVGWIHL
jgi:hypothetical protein